MLGALDHRGFGRAQASEAQTQCLGSGHSAVDTKHLAWPEVPYALRIMVLYCTDVTQEECSHQQYLEGHGDLVIRLIILVIVIFIWVI